MRFFLLSVRHWDVPVYWVLSFLCWLLVGMYLLGQVLC